MIFHDLCFHALLKTVTSRHRNRIIELSHGDEAFIVNIHHIMSTGAGFTLSLNPSTHTVLYDEHPNVLYVFSSEEKTNSRKKTAG